MGVARSGLWAPVQANCPVTDCNAGGRLFYPVDYLIAYVGLFAKVWSICRNFSLLFSSLTLMF